MTSLCGLLCWFAIFPCWKWQKVLLRSIDHCIFCWPCCWARCWMLQDMYHMEASWVCYVKVGRFHQFEQSKISVLTVTSLGIVMLTIHSGLMVSVWFIEHPGDVKWQTSPDILSAEEFPCYIYQTWDISCRSSRYIPANIQTTSPRLAANHGTVGIPCS